MPSLSATSKPQIPSGVNMELVQMLLPHLEPTLKRTSSSPLLPKVQVAVFISAVSDQGGFFDVARRFRISFRLVAPTVLEVSTAINSVFTFPKLSQQRLREVARHFEEKTTFPRLAGYLGFWNGFTLLCDVDGQVLAVNEQVSYGLKEAMFWARIRRERGKLSFTETAEKFQELLPPPEPLDPDSSKDLVGFRFATIFQERRHPLFYIPYYTGWRSDVTEKNAAFQSILLGVLKTQANFLCQLEEMFPFKDKEIPRQSFREVVCSCLHLYNLMKRFPRCMNPRAGRSRSDLLPPGYFERTIDPERDQIANYFYQKAYVGVCWSAFEALLPCCV
uniref:DDE_Tnp_1_7 domain-containing protein n=1 Tax=Steinernema glaseri TaxID=37863 RepID=A0A1I8A441_9BILA